MMNFLRGNAAAKLDASEAIAKLAKGEITVLDVREPNEVAASGSALGGVQIPLSMVPLMANPQGPDYDARFDPNKPVAVFCAVGGRAEIATQALKRMGYEAHNIGGFNDWTAAGGPVKR